MKQRIFSFVLLWLLVILIPWWLGEPGVVLLLAAFAFLTQLEIYGLLARMSARAMKQLGLALGLLISVGSYFGPGLRLEYAAIFAGSVVIVTLAFLFLPAKRRIFSTIAATVFGLALGPLMLGFLSKIVLLAGIPLGLWVIGVAKFADVGGLLVGMAIGRHKLAPALSPKKTWEGVIGGVCFSIAAGTAAAMFLPGYFPAAFSPLSAGLIAIPVAISGICADLFESALKREAGTKDAGKLFPGIGGAFDLTDSLLLAAPVGYLCLRPLLG